MIKYIKRFLAFFYYIIYKYISPNPTKASYGYWFYIDGDNHHLLNHNLTSKSVVFEIGGYTGVFAERLKNKFDSEIYIFEPVQKFFKELEAKFDTDPKVHLFNHGLSNVTKKEKISLLGDSSSTILNTTGSEEEILLLDIKEFMDAHKEITIIDLVNMNIEGGEYTLLPRMIELGLMSQINVLQVQFHNYFPEAIEDREEIINQLQQTHDHYFKLPFIWDQFKLK